MLVTVRLTKLRRWRREELLPARRMSFENDQGQETLPEQITQRSGSYPES
jgi:hypothetical protein